MEESMQQVFGLILGIVNDEKLGLSKKIDAVVKRYIDSLLENPNLPLFVLSEIQANPQRLMKKIGITDLLVANNNFYRQMQEQIDIKGIKGITPLHIFINIVSMTVFPIVGRPLLVSIHAPMTDEDYMIFLDERRKLVPMWIKTMLKLDE